MEPHIYPFADFLARRLNAHTFIVVGSESARHLAAEHPGFAIVGLDAPGKLASCRRDFPSHTWLDWDLEAQPAPSIDLEILSGSVIVCADVIGHLAQPQRLLSALRQWLGRAPLALLSAPNRDFFQSSSGDVLETRAAEIRAWSGPEFRTLIESVGIRVDLLGHTEGIASREKDSLLTILRRGDPSLDTPAIPPPGFRPVAILATYNDEQIIVPILNRILEQGLEAYIIDNWSTDRTWDLLHEFKRAHPEIIGVERFPSAAPADYMWQEILKRKEELAQELQADWFIHWDSDEVRLSPWPELNLRQAIYSADREGFNALDHTILNFYPTTGEDFPPGASPEEHLKYFDFGHRPGHFLRINAWKKQPQRVNLADGGGHNVQFPDRRVYPYKFIIKHYSVLSQAHGVQKILLDRLPRTEREFAERKAHTHLRLYKPGHQFFRDPSTLTLFDHNFYDRYLVEYLSGLGVALDPQST